EWKGKRVRLNFGAVDYRADVWVNGEHCGSHEGGQTSFSFDITPHLDGARTATIVVRAEDPSTDVTIPRGKQYWEERSRGIWYTPPRGIWQPVWLEPVSDPFVERVVTRPNVDESAIRIEGRVSRPAAGLRLRARVELKGEAIGTAETNVAGDL